MNTTAKSAASSVEYGGHLEHQSLSHALCHAALSGSQADRSPRFGRFGRLLAMPLGLGILVGVLTFLAPSLVSGAGVSTPQGTRLEWLLPKDASSVVRLAAQATDSHQGQNILTGPVESKAARQEANGIAVVRSRAIGLAPFWHEITILASSAASVAAISTPITSSHTEITLSFDGKSRMVEPSANPATIQHSDRRKLGEFGESPTGLAEDNTEPSRWMKHAGGRCDGQSVPRTGMRLTSAQRESQREEMTWPVVEATEAGNRKPAITQASPTDTPLFTMFRKAKVNNVQTEWLTDNLDQAATNAVAEGSSATFQSTTARVRLTNLTQISREAYDISDTQRAVNPAGIRDEYVYQMGKGLKQWKRDVEHDIVAGSAATATPASTRCARGIHFTLSGFSSLTATVSNSAVNTAQPLQEDDLNLRLQAVWTNGGLCDYVVCTPATKRQISSAFAGSANSRRNIAATENRVINVVDFYDSDFGNVKILPHRWLTSAAPGTTNLQRVTYVLQSDKWVVGFLRPPRNVPLAKIGSSERAMVEGEWTLICLHPSANSFVSGHHSGTFANNFPVGI